MALIDEQKLQTNVVKLIDLLKQQVQCCHIVSSGFASSSLISAGVFYTVDQSGNIKVFDAPGGVQLTPGAYGTLTKP